MKTPLVTRRNAAAAALLLALAGVGAITWLHLTGSGGHGHGPHEAMGLVLDNGKLWATDAPLRTGMGRIRDVVRPVAAASATRALSRDEAVAVSGAIKEQVQFLVENCKLEPRADAVLHVLLNTFIEGADALAAETTSKAGLERIVKALDLYPQYFDHQGWRTSPGNPA